MPSETFILPVCQKSIGGMNTLKRMDNKTEYHDFLMNQINDIYAGNLLVCPECKKKTAKAKFVFFPDNIGFCVVECPNCNIAVEVMSRLGRTDNIKAEIVEEDW